MRRYLLTIIFSCLISLGFAQTWPLTGEVITEDQSPLVYATVVLLNPADSTMQAYGITNRDGKFDIKNIRKGDYLLQVAFLGYETFYRPVSIPSEGNQAGRITMKPRLVDVGEVQVTGEYVPMAFRGDTTEYRAAAFQLKPGAMTEELLKKLPGVEVDRSGNIKAMGEDVRRVMVNGKEFFGNDPKVATRNLPAEAIDKVQIYDRTSEESMFTGIRDGSREKTINLNLKEDRKNGVFGNVTGGAGTSERWAGSGRVYRFSDKTQVAALGMGNNINQAGFSFEDYINFSGGLGGMVHGGGSAQIRITSDGSFPINFGQPVSGLNTTGAGGANFSYSKSQHDRVFLSYLGSGSEKNLEQTTVSRNYTANSSFLQNEEVEERDRNQSHRFNFGWRNRIDSTQNLVIDGNFALSNGNNRRFSEMVSLREDIRVNSLDYRTTNTSDRINGTAGGSWLKKLDHGNSVFKITGNLAFSQALTENQINSATGFPDNDAWKITQSNRFQNNDTGSLNGSLGTAFTRKIGNFLYLEPEIRAGSNLEDLVRTQGNLASSDLPDENSHPEFSKNYSWIRPRISLMRNLAKTRMTLALQVENGRMSTTLNGQQSGERVFTSLLPSFMYENEYKTGRRLMANYSSQVNTPGVTQLLPVVNDINPLAVYYGNPELDPEKSHRLSMHWLIFDQFSFTSLMTTLSGTYTRDKINWDRTIKDNLSFENTMTNVDSDYDARGNIDFSTPIRAIGMKVRLNLEERWNRGINLINQAENVYTNNTHRVSLSIDNRKKDKWDVNTGVEATLTEARYTVQKNLNNNYFSMSWFGEARFTPNQNWNFIVNADVTNYTDQSFGEEISVPLFNAEINRYFLKNKRGTLTLRGFDLLDRNNIIQRMSELNYLREVRSNSMGRYVMLSFTYRLNQFAGESKGMEIRLRR
ncbi:MAG: outer membrane beta-barrel protein [Bacteroidota bacterium]